MPKITVAMPVYNDASYVREAIDSILTQTFHDFELLIIDDGSTDVTPDIIATYKDPRIRVISFTKNRGRPFACNAALDSARGEYLAWMDADDVSLPHRLELQVTFLDAHPDIAVCGCALQCFHERHDIVRFPVDADSVLAGIIWGPTIPNAASCMRLSSINLHNLRFRETLLRAQDYGFWTDVLLSAKLQAVNLPDTLYHWRYFHRPTSSAYHAKAAQYVLQYLDLPDDETSAHVHTLFSCSEDSTTPGIDTQYILHWANRVYETVRLEGHISMQAFLPTIHLRVEKLLSRTNNLVSSLLYYRHLALAKEHALWHLMLMIAARKGYACAKALRACIPGKHI